MRKARRNYPPVVRPQDGRERVMVGLRMTPAQKAQLARLGDGSLVIGFDRALEFAAAAKVESRT